jgi:hypothetical protein
VHLNNSVHIFYRVLLVLKNIRNYCIREDMPRLEVSRYYSAQYLWWTIGLGWYTVENSDIGLWRAKSDIMFNNGYYFLLISESLERYLGKDRNVHCPWPWSCPWPRWYPFSCNMSMSTGMDTDTHMVMDMLLDIFEKKMFFNRISDYPDIGSISE